MSYNTYTGTYTFDDVLLIWCSSFPGMPLTAQPRVILLFYTDVLSTELPAAFLRQYDGKLIVAGGVADGILLPSHNQVANNCNHQ